MFKEKAIKCVLTCLLALGMLTNSGWAMGIEPAESEQAAVMGEQKETEPIKPKVEAEKTPEIAEVVEEKGTETVEAEESHEIQQVQELKVVSIKELKAPEELPESIRENFRPVFSPDGKKMAIADEHNIWIMDDKMRILQKLSVSPEGKIIGPLCKFLADGTRIACLEKVNSKINKIKIVDLKTGKIIKEVKIDGDIWWSKLSFFPDGRKILYEKYYEGWVMDINKNEKKLIFKGGIIPLLSPDVLSPDGNKIVFIKNRAIWLMNADGSEAREIAKGWAGGVSRISWFPDSKRVCYSTKDHKIYVFDIEKNEAKEITKGYEPVVSYDGSRIAYFRDTLVKELPVEIRPQDPAIPPDYAYKNDVYIINLNGRSVPINITNNPLNSYNPFYPPFDWHLNWIDNNRIRFWCGHKKKWVIIALE
jgi:Tol biopolymer transport system component